jgi:trigger factor
MAEQENLELSDDEIENGFKEIAQNVSRSLAEISDFYKQNKEKLDVYKHSLLEKKVIKLIMDHGTITEVEPQTENKVAGETAPFATSEK